MRALATLFAVSLASCSEYGLTAPENPVVPDDPEPAGPPAVAVDPASVDLGVACDALRADVTITNVGGAPLTVQAIEVGGGGWTMEPPQLPIVLAPTQALVVHPRDGDGEGTLRVVTDDPERPTVDVPLRGALNRPPAVALEAPADGWTLPVGGVIDLVARVSDPDEPPETLTARWTSSVDGPLGNAPARADGRAILAWDAAARTEGPHHLSVEVSDACGATATAAQVVCQNRGYVAADLDLRSWNFEGSARWDAARGVVQLTPPLLSQAGTAFQISETVDTSNIDIRFKFYMGGGTGADGLSLTVLDADRMTSFVGQLGGGIGYAGLPGFSVEVDTYYNGHVDPTSSHHVSVHLDGDQARVLAWAALPKMDDAVWHDMRVTVDGARMTVTIDGATHIDFDVPGLVPFRGYIGFTGATGALTNDHLIDELRVERFVCDEG
jgi:hypothetical protein